MNQSLEKKKSWRQWGIRHAAHWSQFIALLPPAGEPAFDFRLAHLIRDHCLTGAADDAISPKDKKARPAIRRLGADTLSAPARCLGLDGSTQHWSAQTLGLREKLLKADSTEIAKLAQQASLLEEPAPWLVWACLSQQPEQSLRELKAAGYKQKLMDDPEICFPAMAMGFQGQPVFEWISWLAELCEPEYFCFPNSAYERFYSFLTDLAESSPSSFPKLPIRKQCGEAYSKSLDAMDAGSRCPLWILLSQALGKEPAAAGSSDVLKSILESPLAAACMGSASGGFPTDTEGPWPLALSLDGYNGLDPALAEKIIKLGASLGDIHTRSLPLWAYISEPSAETGSEGNFIILEPALLDFFEKHGVDFDASCFIQSGYADFLADKGFCGPKINLLDFLKATLPPDRAQEACALIAPYMARAEAAEISKTTRKGAPSAKHSKAI